MNTKFDTGDRRILTFPAVRPYEFISPETLLGSLVPLCRNISNFQSNSFPAQRRNSRETIRKVGILAMFFEEILDSNSVVLPNSAVLSLSELHLVAQKIKFLLEDCSREGARLLMLTKCEFLAAQFRVLVRAVAAAVEALPLDSIGVDDEVKELVELVHKQSNRAKVEVDQDDKTAVKRLQAILSQFEMGIEPDLCGVRRVLDHIRIRSWSDCNQEIKFLEEEIGLEWSDGDEGEVQFLSSLVGFLSYCRGVIFDTLDHQDLNQLDARLSPQSCLSFLNPADFKCPISLELMLDPVTVSTGQTYDRSSIQKWLDAGHMLCPKTGEMLTKTELVPNSILRKLIRSFCANNGVCLDRSGRQRLDINRTIQPGSEVFAGAVKFLSRFLTTRLAFGTSQQKNKAAYEVRLLGKSNIFNRSSLIKAGAVPHLLNLLSSGDQSTQENSIAALLKLSKHARGKKLIVTCGGLTSVVHVLEHGLSLEAKQSAAATIFYLSSVKEYRKLVGETTNAIPALVDLIKEGKTCGKKNAVVAIFGLLLSAKNHQIVLEAGAIPLLVDILASPEKIDQLVGDSLAVLSVLAGSVEGAHAIMSTDCLHLIIRILQTSESETAKEYCVSILLGLSINGGMEVVAILSKDSTLMPALFSLLTNGTPHSGKKARSLIKILHNFYDTSTSRWMVRREECIRER